MKLGRTIILFLIIFCISIFTIIPLFHQGLFPVHDDTQVTRVFTMAKALQDGYFPVRWVDYLGYSFGYPIFNFYAPLAYYFAGFLSIMGMSSEIATKVMMGVGMVGAAYTMYLLGSSIFSKKAGLIAGIFYLYAPYHALDLYVRGAIGELWAYAFFPLPLWGIVRLYQTQKLRYVLAISLGYSAIILAHNLTAMIVTPFIIAIAGLMILRKQGKHKLVYFIPAGLVFGGLLSSFYVLPALLELSYTNVNSILGGGSNPLDHFICASQLWQSPWGYGGSVPGCLDGMSFVIGKIHILGTIIGILASSYFYRKKKNRDATLYAIILLACVFIISLFFTQEYSKSIWKSVSVMQFIQFPWRFLLVSSLATSLLVGAGIYVIEKYNKLLSTVIGIVLILGCLIYYSKYFKPQYYITDITKYTALSSISYDISKISDEYLPQDFSKPKNISSVPHKLIEPISGEITEVKIDEKTQRKIVQLTSTNALVKLNLAYFPAWQIRVDGDQIRPNVNHGIYSFPLSEGSHVISIKYTQTPIEKIANLISFVSFSLLILGIIKARRLKVL